MIHQINRSIITTSEIPTKSEAKSNVKFDKSTGLFLPKKEIVQETGLLVVVNGKVIEQRK